MGYGRGHGMPPKSFNDIWFSPTMWCMCCNNSAFKEARPHFDDQKPWVSGHNRQCLVSEPPTLVGCSILLEGNGLFFCKSQHHTKLGRECHKWYSGCCKRKGVLNLVSCNAKMVTFSWWNCRTMDCSRAQCGMLNTVTASHKSQHITGENTQLDNCIVLSGYLPIDLKWSYRSRVRRGVRLCWKKRHII